MDPWTFWTLIPILHYSHASTDHSLRWVMLHCYNSLVYFYQHRLYLEFFANMNKPNDCPRNEKGFQVLTFLVDLNQFNKTKEIHMEMYPDSELPWSLREASGFKFGYCPKKLLELDLIRWRSDMASRLQLPAQYESILPASALDSALRSSLFDFGSGTSICHNSQNS